MTEYEQVPDNILNLVTNTIQAYHPHLSECAIGIVFRLGKTPTKGGRLVLGKVGKVSDELKPYLDADLDFLMVLSSEAWDELTEAQRAALVDHELCHIVGNAEDGYKLRGHDIEEFNDIITRHGLWQADLLAAASAFEGAKQGSFLPPVEKRGKVVSVSFGGYDDGDDE